MTCICGVYGMHQLLSVGMLARRGAFVGYRAVHGCPSPKLGDGRPFTLCDRLRVERACATTSLTASDGAILADDESERR